MVAWDSEDRTVITSERLVKLVVVVLRLAEVVNDVSQMKKECRSRGAAVHHISSHRVGHGRFMLDRRQHRLRAVHLCRSGIAHGMKRNLSGVGDRIDNLFWNKV